MNDSLSDTSKARRLALPKFLVVGGLGTLTNLTIFFILVDLREWHPTIGAIIAFVAAVTQNYVLNHRWTFAHQVGGTRVSFQGFTRFFVVALVALGVNLIVLWAVLKTFDPALKVFAQAAGILAGTAVNFLGSKLWVFSSNE